MDAAQSSISGFSEILPNPTLVDKLNSLSLRVPTPVQAETIPAAMRGDDLIVQAKTGSGKTLAFALPLIHRLSTDSSLQGTVGLVVAPTRELATQIAAVIKAVSGIQPACLVGGASSRDQERVLQADPRIVVGTPGRITDFLEQRILDLANCSYVVLDEADEMLSDDFIDAIRGILRKANKNRQSIFISATITPRVEMFTREFLKNPVTIHISTPGSEMPSIEHLVIETSSELTAKVNTLADILEVEKPRSAIIFCNTKSDTEFVEVFLRRRGFDARRINSDLTQRQRDWIMAKIRAGELQFLIGTDIAARGIDIEQLDLVIHYSIPPQPEVYIHRSGRTGRAGRSGRAISLVGPQDFAPFQNLRKAELVKLQKMEAPSESTVIQARIARLEQQLEKLVVQPSSRDATIAREIVKHRNNGADAPEGVTNLVTSLIKFTTEHLIRTEMKSLDEELNGSSSSSSGSEQPPREENEGGERRRGGGYRGGRGRGRR